jgi:adenosylmethionine-8-amino-7-oxononanoate aminotransferase
MIANDNANYLWHPMIEPKITEANAPMVIERGEGCYIFDSAGRKILDCNAGMWCVNVGYGRQEVIEAIHAQLQKISYASIFGNSASPPVLELSARLIRMLEPEGMSRVLFGSGGSDAVETALKMARHYWKLMGKAGKTKFISLKNSYHGLHFGGTSATGGPIWRNAYEPLLPGFLQVDGPDLYRGIIDETPDAHGRRLAAILEREIAYQGPGSVAAVLVEPIQGAGAAVNIPPASYWPALREICDRHDVLLIADEVITGFGRTGSMFGSRYWGVKPDMMCFAKGINSAYVPLGATVLNERVAEAWRADHPLSTIATGYTYSGHPVACAAALANLDIVEREDLPGNAERVGAYFLQRLQELLVYDTVGQVRGAGLMLGIELVRDKGTKTGFAPSDAYLSALHRAIGARNAQVRLNGSRFILSPPLVFTPDHVDEAMDALHGAFSTTPLTVG